jgi:hypothetical protein
LPVVPAAQSWYNPPQFNPGWPRRKRRRPVNRWITLIYGLETRTTSLGRTRGHDGGMGSSDYRRLLCSTPAPRLYRFVGFDIVSRSHAPEFEHSPLSCNGVAEKETVNAHCLVDDAETALRLARDFSEQEGRCEPGPYYILEVWRRQT